MYSYVALPAAVTTVTEHLHCRNVVLSTLTFTDDVTEDPAKDVDGELIVLHPGHVTSTEVTAAVPLLYLAENDRTTTSFCTRNPFVVLNDKF